MQSKYGQMNTQRKNYEACLLEAYMINVCVYVFKVVLRSLETNEIKSDEDRFQHSVKNI